MIFCCTSGSPLIRALGGDNTAKDKTWWTEVARTTIEVLP